MPEINVALIGYSFMGRAHSNAYRQVTPFFSPRLTPRMKVLCGRNAAGGAQGRGPPRLGGDGHRLARGDRPRRHRPRGREHARGQPRRDRHRRRARGQGGLLREAARQHAGGGEGDAGRGEKGRRRPHDLPQLPARARGAARAAARRGGPAGQDPPLPRDLPAGLDRRPEVPAAVAAAEEPRRVRRARATSPPTSVDLARFLVGEITEVAGAMETFIKRRPLPGNPKKTGAVTVDDAAHRAGALRERRPRAPSRPAAWRPGAATATASRSTAARAAWPSTSSG